MLARSSQWEARMCVPVTGADSSERPGRLRAAVAGASEARGAGGGLRRRRECWRWRATRVAGEMVGGWLVGWERV